MRVFLTGAAGQVGKCFQSLVNKNYPNVTLLATDRNQLDITDESAVEAIIAVFKPDVIINAAAYTAVDRAESERQLAFAVNAQAVGHLARAAKKHHVHLIHISTDYVFSAEAYTPIKEDHPCQPQNIYGLSKLAGESEAMACPHATIIRTSWVFSEFGNNFLKTMLRLADTHPTINVVADQIGCPTYAGDIASLLMKIIFSPEKPQGIYHYCGSGAVSWYDFARVILEQAWSDKMIAVKPALNAITTEHYQTPAKRPLYSVLNTGKISVSGFPPEPWLKSVPVVLAQLRKGSQL